MIKAEIIADSFNIYGNRLTTYVLVYPRFIHADFMTHRLFSRNASSSRARPITKVIEEAENTPALPIFWGKNQKGMQSFVEFDEMGKILCKLRWNDARIAAIEQAKKLNQLGLHKQYVNRILEPFTHITVICSATDYGNFFNLRAHKDAMPEIQELAFQMLNLYHNGCPQLLKPGQWHLPFADKYINDLKSEELCKISTARAARVSYLNHEGKIDYEKDFQLHDDLAEDGHWSPFEHPAMSLQDDSRHGNFKGFKQYRKFFEREHRATFNADELIQQRGKR